MDITHAKITKIAREVGRFVSQQLREDGVGPSEFDVIHAVRKHDGISQARICELLGRDKGAVARQVKSLCLRGYIVRRPSRSDKRAYELFPTAKAEQLKKDKRALETAYYSYLLEGLSEEEAARFAELLDKVYSRSKEESKREFASIKAEMEDSDGKAE